MNEKVYIIGEAVIDGKKVVVSRCMSKRALPAARYVKNIKLALAESMGLELGDFKWFIKFDK